MTNKEHKCYQCKKSIVGRVDHDVCNYLHISNRTLQRLRAKNCVSYSRINGKNFFRISDIRHLLESKMIRSNEEYLNDLIQNAKYYAQ